MSDANHNVQAVYNQLAEYFHIDDSLAGLNDRNTALQAKIVDNNRDMSALIGRQDEIARKLKASFSRANSILWRRDGKDHVVRYVCGGLEIERLYGPQDLAEPATPRVFSDEDVSEAALFAAADDVDAEDGFIGALERLGMLDPGDDDDDTGEFTPIGDVSPWDQDKTMVFPGPRSTVRNSRDVKIANGVAVKAGHGITLKNCTVDGIAMPDAVTDQAVS